MNKYMRYFLEDDDGTNPPAAGTQEPDVKGTPAGQEEKDAVAGAKAQRPAWFGQITKDEEAQYGDKLRSFAKISDLAKAYVDLAGKQTDTTGMVRIPKEGSTQEEIDAYKDALGIPKDGNYTLDDDASLYTADGKQVDGEKKVYDAMKKQVVELAKESGLTARQANEVWAHQLAFIKAANKAQADYMGNLQQTFGARVDNLYRKEYPDEKERQEALNADIAVIGRSFSAMPNLAGAVQRAGIMLDPVVVKELAGYLRSVGAGNSAHGKSPNPVEKEGKPRGLTFSPEFYEHIKEVKNGNRG